MEEYEQMSPEERKKNTRPLEEMTYGVFVGPSSANDRLLRGEVRLDE